MLFTKVPELLEYRQRYVQTLALGIQAGYKPKRTQYQITEDGKMHIIYVGDKMKVVGGKLTWDGEIRN